ncbi:MAG TPA: carboxypeptidase-like regulatory domain-containing protein [Vicinamibacterales bacterium]
MPGRLGGLRVVFLLGALLLVARIGHAQVAIAGSVKDTTGAVMPGVTVEAASPALIERTRSVQTGANGQYQIVDLRPGEYVVTFTLPGFKSVRRGGIILEGNFTAAVNAELQVGAVEETVTVNAESPTVDTITTQTSFVLNRETLDSIPTPIRNTPMRAALIPGTTVTAFVLGQYNLTSHGSSTTDFTMAIDGLRVNNLCGSGQFSGFYMNDGAVQELTYLTGAESAEVQSSGIRVNQVPKDGGNRFSGGVFFQGRGSGLQSDNRSDTVKNAGVLIAGTAYDYQINPAFGGPLAKDKLWFYMTYKYEDAKVYVPSAKFPDGSQAYRNLMGNYSYVGRLTWAASSKDKVRAYLEKQFNGEFYNGFNTYPLSTPEAATDAWGRGYIPQVRWTRTHSDKLLIEAGFAYYNQPYEQNCSRTAPGGTALPHWNVSTNLVTGRCGYLTPAYSSTTKDSNVLASASYVTGSHALKFGVTDLWGQNSRTFAPHANIDTLVTLNVAGLVDYPYAVVVYNSPASAFQNVNSDLGLYGQDAWTMNRLTLNYGARFEHFNASVPAESSAASTWIAARNFAEIPNVPNWNDWAVRFAASYDLFGDGKTAIKGNVGKYVAAQASGFAQNFNGMSGVTETRSWVDLNNDRTILNADGSVQTNEVGPGASNYGQVTSFPDPNLKRGYNWEYSALVQRELRPRLAVSAGYYHRDFYNLQVVDNSNISASDWTQYSINTPTDPRLPLSGTAIPMYTLTAGKFNNEVHNVWTYSNNNITAYNGLEFTVNARGAKYLIFGGLTTDRRAETSCDGSTNVTGTSPRDNPNSLRFCDSILPFRSTLKTSAAYTFPYDIQVSGSFSSIPQGQIRADYQVTAAVAGRPVVNTPSGGNFTTVNLVQSNTMFLERQNLVNMRLGKIFKFGGTTKVQGFMDVFNLFNAGYVTSVNQSYAASGPNLWLAPTGIVDGRYAQFGMQLTF